MRLWPLGKAFPTLSPKDQRDLISLFLALVVTAVYLPSIRFGFVNYDDPDYLFLNPHVRFGLSAEAFWWGLTSLHGDVAYWHPLTWLSHQLDFQIFKSNAGAHHFTSVLIHAATTVLVFLVAAKVTGKMAAGLMAALFFGIHPLRVESVAWLAERKDVLCACFYFATILLYFRYVDRPNWKGYVAVLFAFLFALMSKPMAVTIPCVLLLLDIWPLRRLLRWNVSLSSLNSIFRRAAPQFPIFKLSKLPDTTPLPGNPSLSTVRRALFEKIPLFALAAVGSFLALEAQKDLKAIIPLEVLPVPERLANALVSYVAYLYKSVLPMQLSVHYGHPLVQPLGLVMISAVTLAMVTGLGFRIRRKQPLFLFGWVWFLGTLVPTIGLVQAGSQSMADRYTYIPGFGLALMLAALADFQFVQGLHRRLWFQLTLAAIGLGLLVRTEGQLAHWRNSRTLFEQAVAVDPADFVAHTNLGKAYEEVGRMDLAMSHYQAALLSNPGAAHPNLNLGDLFIRQGKPAFALQFYHRALRGGARLEHFAHHGLGKVYAELGQPELAIRHCRQAVRLKPSYCPPKMELAELLATVGDDRLRSGREAVKLALEVHEERHHNEPEFLLILATAFAEDGQFQRAAQIAETAGSKARAAKNSALSKMIQERLERFRKHEPFHRAPPNIAPNVIGTPQSEAAPLINKLSDQKSRSN